MRDHKPIISTKALTVLALAEDVKEVLGDPQRFTAGLYGPKMQAVTGPFILGVDDTPLYHHDHAAMDRAVRREDMAGLGEAMLGFARELVAGAGEQIDEDAALWRAHLDGLIDARKAAVAGGEEVPDDVLTRLLRFRDEGEPKFHDIAIRHNILGNIVGWIPRPCPTRSRTRSTCCWSARTTCAARRPPPAPAT